MRQAGRVLSKSLLGLSSRQQYWDHRYECEDALWGLETEIFDEYLRAFTNEKARRILILGCGYGRSVASFGEGGCDAIGLDFSKRAIQIGRKFARNCKSTEVVLASVCNIPFKEDYFEGIFAYNIMHLLLNAERSSFIREIERVTKENGVVVIVAHSFLDEGYGKGIAVETNTFCDESGNKVTHFFSEDEMLEYLDGYSIVEISTIKIREQHGGKSHVHHAIRAVAKKVSKLENKQVKET